MGDRNSFSCRARSSATFPLEFFLPQLVGPTRLGAREAKCAEKRVETESKHGPLIQNPRRRRGRDPNGGECPVGGLLRLRQWTVEGRQNTPCLIAAGGRWERHTDCPWLERFPLAMGMGPVGRSFLS